MTIGRRDADDAPGRAMMRIGANNGREYMRWIVAGQPRWRLRGNCRRRRRAIEDGRGAAPGWMTGCWCSETGEKWTEECWMRAAWRHHARRRTQRQRRDAATIGKPRRSSPARTGNLPFGLHRKAGRGSAFRWFRAGTQEIVFANPAHDYPQRIRYWREGAALNAEISLIDGSKAMRWQYRRVQ